MGSTLPAMVRHGPSGPRHTADGRTHPAERAATAERGGVLADGIRRAAPRQRPSRQGARMIFDPKPAIIGHRGFGAGERDGYRENTLESYLAAVAHGLTWVELDVQRSRDGRLVLRHDPVTGNDEFIASLDASELAASGIPLFEDVMAALPPGVGVNLDVKTIIEDAVDPPDRRTAALVAAALRAHAGRRPLFVSRLARRPGCGQPRTERGLPAHWDARDAPGAAAPDGPHHHGGDRGRAPGRLGSGGLAGKPGQSGPAGRGRRRRAVGQRCPGRARRPGWWRPATATAHGGE